MIVYVGGIPGAGKTTIITEMEKIARSRGINLERIVGTKILCELAGVLSVEELRKLSETERRKFRFEMNRRIYEMDANDFGTIRVGDGHFVFWDIHGENYGIHQIFPWDKKQTIAIAVIDADEHMILERRKKDFSKRSDRQLNLDFINKERRMEIEIAFSQAKELGIPIKIFENNKNSVDISRDLLTFIQECVLKNKKARNV